MAKETISGSVSVEGLNETIRAFRQLDKQASADARDQAMNIAQKLAGYIRAATPGGDRRYQNLGATVKASRDRVPVIRVGGRVNPKVSGGGTPANLVMGMEFGADQRGPNAWRFPPRTPKKGRGNEGYWIFPEAHRRQPEITALWFDAMDKTIAKWSD
jgi:hypothetical protein